MKQQTNPESRKDDNRNGWQVFVDTGGTFTDCLALDPEGHLHRQKVLSSSRIRGEVRRKTGPETINIRNEWGAPDADLTGFSVYAAGRQIGIVEHWDGNGRPRHNTDKPRHGTHESGHGSHKPRHRTHDSLHGAQEPGHGTHEPGHGTLTLDRPVDTLKPGSVLEFGTGEEAPVLAIRLITGTPVGENLPVTHFRLATTRGTNALLERTIARTALLTNNGHTDVLRIGDQRRPDLFALRIHKPEPLHAVSLAVNGRMSAEGEELEPVDNDQIRRLVQNMKDDGIEACAVSLLNSYANPGHEQQIARVLKQEGINPVTISSELAAFAGFLTRTETTLVNAALAPVIVTYLNNIAERIPEARIFVMTSAGNLTGRRHFRPGDSLLSGPAGGVVGASVTGRSCGFSRIISFDMGGTSTDVAMYDGKMDFQFEHRVGHARMMAPAVRIETVAAGGGSICSYDGFKLTVGPRSAGADPGPACYGNGGPLTVTDVNLLAGRLTPDNFSIPVDRNAADDALQQLLDKMGEDDRDRVLASLIEIANERMAEAIRVVSVKRGLDPFGCALVAFGGAGGQHACSIAHSLGIPEVVFPADAGLLSAVGLRHAPIERFAERQLLMTLEESGDELNLQLEQLEQQAFELLSQEGVDREDAVVSRRILTMRLKGQESGMHVDLQPDDSPLECFLRAYEQRYGYRPGGRSVEVVSARVVASEKRNNRDSEQPDSRDSEQPDNRDSEQPDNWDSEQPDWREDEPHTGRRDEKQNTRKGDEKWNVGKRNEKQHAGEGLLKPDKTIEALTISGRQNVPVFDRRNLYPGTQLSGPALILDPHSTTWVETGWSFGLRDNGQGVAVFKGIDESATTNESKKPGEPATPGKSGTTGESATPGDSKNPAKPESSGESQAAGPERSGQTPQISTRIRPKAAELELFTNRFQSIALEMGEMLRRTAVSVNVKERLDFSCALLDAAGRLVVNAPHIPVHLGAIGTCVRSVTGELDLKDGDIAVTNHPAYGGSHLPDVTVIAPVYHEGQLRGYVANRCHHAELGGTRPGSMPADAVRLSEEGVVIAPQYLVRDGRPLWDRIRNLLTGAPWPSRAVDDNLADLHAAVAACNRGIAGLQKLCREFGADVVTDNMKALTRYAASRMSRKLQQHPDGGAECEERLDDGTPLRVRVNLRGDMLSIDFSGTGGVHPGNLNATPAIVNSAVVYLMRLLIGEPLPLNDGLLWPVDLRLPRCLLNPGFDPDPDKCPAVVGGNVETSQRLVDTLLKPFGIAACSQGTMNNLLFGDREFGFYETICGGTGAGDGYHGTDAVHHHMTNTRITDPEIMEYRYPVRVRRFEIRPDSGGGGQFHGGNGVIRELEFLRPLEVSLLTQHRVEAPYGMNGGEAGAKGEQFVIRSSGTKEPVAGSGSMNEPDPKTGNTKEPAPGTENMNEATPKTENTKESASEPGNTKESAPKTGNTKEPAPGTGNLNVREGDRLLILTPGGGGFGSP